MLAMTPAAKAASPPPPAAEAAATETDRKADMERTMTALKVAYSCNPYGESLLRF